MVVYFDGTGNDGCFQLELNFSRRGWIQTLPATSWAQIRSTKLCSLSIYLSSRARMSSADGTICVAA